MYFFKKLYSRYMFEFLHLPPLSALLHIVCSSMLGASGG